MACPWLDKHAHEVIDVLWGHLPGDASFWDHLRQCEVCAQTFDEMNRCLGLLQKAPSATPPRLVYLPRPTPRRGLSVGRIALTVLIGGLIGWAIAQWVFHRQIQSAILVQQRQTAMLCQRAAHGALEDLRAQLERDHQALLQFVEQRLQNYNTTLVQLREDINLLHRRQQFLWQDTRAKIDTIIQSTYDKP